MNAAAPFLLMLALLSGWWLARGRQRQLTLSDSDQIAINLSAICGAMLGARIPFWLEQGLTGGNWLWWADGKTILGGILGAYITVEVVKEIRGIRVLTGDSFALPASIMIGIGRMACFCSGCCFGQPTSLPWGVHFPTAPDTTPTPRHPTQIYEAMFHLIAAGVIILAEKKGWLKGQRLKAYLIAYMLFRFGTEYIRPEPQIFLSLTAYQWTALCLLIALVVQWRWHASRMAAGSLQT